MSGPVAVIAAPGAMKGRSTVPFLFRSLRIPEVVLVEAKAFPDDRGYFMETYKQSDFSKNGITAAFVQDNCSYSARGVLRGLHYQRHPAGQAKLVMATRGSIYDVAVDLRRGSPTFAQWVAEELSDANHRMLFVPAGFAHGFFTLSEEAQVLYRVTAEYAPDADGGIRWDDPTIGVNWPAGHATLSKKDARLPTLQQADLNFEYGKA